MTDLALRLLLFLYPTDTRRRFGREMLDFMRWRRRQLPGGPARFWLFLLGDTVRSVPAAHMAIWAERRGRAPGRVAGDVSRPAGAGSREPRRGPFGPLVPDSRQGRRNPMRLILRDLRFGARTLARSRGFTAIAILTLAVGIGANTAVFSLMHTILFNPLPYPGAEDLVVIESSAPTRAVEWMPVSYPDFIDFQRLSRTMSGVAGFWNTSFTMTGEGGPERVVGAEVSWNITDVLGVEPLLGRGFRPDEEGPEVERVVLIGEGLWKRRYGGDPDVVGTTITTGGAPSVIVGVMPAHFRFPDISEIWAPFRFDPVERRDGRFMGVVARLAADRSFDEASTEFDTIAAQLSAQYPESNGDIGARVLTLRDWIFGDDREPVVIFYAIVSMILLLACINVAGLQLARNETRRHEIAVRAAMGAGRLRIIRQLLVESLLLAFAGGALGMVFGYYGRHVLLAMAPAEIPHYFSFQVRPDALLAIVGIVVLSGLLFGLAPAVSVARADLHSVLQSASGRSSDSRSRARFRSGLVAIEVALTLTVLIGANLMVKSALEQEAFDPGFEAENLATIFVTLPDAAYPEDEDRTAYYQDVFERVRSIPGVTGVSIVTQLPVGFSANRWPLYVEGTDIPETGQLPHYALEVCTPGYFSMMGIPLIKGRVFDHTEGADGKFDEFVVTQTFASQAWPDEDPIGKRLAVEAPPGEDTDWIEVIGVVGDTPNAGYGLPAEAAGYFAHRAVPVVDMFLVARTAQDPEAVFGPLREAIWSVDPDVPLSLARTMEQAIRETNWQVGLFSWAFGLFSVIALVLASSGVYGIMAYASARRSREFAIRLALGAQPATLRGIVIRSGLALAGVGILVGLGLSVFGMPMLASMLFHVSPTDLTIYAISVGVMLAVALIASYIPSRRLKHLLPISALSEE